MNILAGKSVCADQRMVTEEADENILTDDEVIPRKEPTTYRCEDNVIFDDNSYDNIYFEELAK